MTHSKLSLLFMLSLPSLTYCTDPFWTQLGWMQLCDNVKAACNNPREFLQKIQTKDWIITGLGITGTYCAYKWAQNSGKLSQMPSLPPSHVSYQTAIDNFNNDLQKIAARYVIETGFFKEKTQYGFAYLIEETTALRKQLVSIVMYNWGGIAHTQEYRKQIKKDISSLYTLIDNNNLDFTFKNAPDKNYNTLVQCQKDFLIQEANNLLSHLNMITSQIEHMFEQYFEEEQQLTTLKEHNLLLYKEKLNDIILTKVPHYSKTPYTDYLALLTEINTELLRVESVRRSRYCYYDTEYYYDKNGQLTTFITTLSDEIERSLQYRNEQNVISLAKNINHLTTENNNLKCRLAQSYALQRSARLR